MTTYPSRICTVLSRLLITGIVLFLAQMGHAQVTLEEGITPSTAWPETVTFQTGDPAQTTTGVGVNGSTMVSQTFTPATNMSLGALYFSYSTATNSTGNSFTLRIQQVPGGSSTQTYTQGTDLLGSTPVTFSLDSTGGTPNLMKFAFAGAYQIPLTAGTTYAVEVSSTGSAMSFFRRGADTYAGGAVYTNRSAVNYPNTRDLAMAVIAASTSSGSGTITTQELPASASVFPEPCTILVDNPIQTTTGAGVNGSTLISQTFTPGKNFNLGAIYMAYSTTTASTANAFTIRIQQVPGPTVQTYTPGTNLLGTASASFSLGNTGGAIKALKIAFNGAAQIPLTAGVTYALEISSTGSTATFYREGSDTYARGNFYTNRNAFNYPNTRDLAIGIIKAGGAGSAVVAGSSFLPIPQAFSLQMLDGNASTNALKDQVAAAGFKNIRKGIYWSRVETTQGVYNFTVSSYDTLINGFTSRGIKPYITLFDGNSLYGETQRAVTTAAGRTGFANFAKATAQHYPTADFEIWNEPNLAYFWAVQPSIQDYVSLASVVGPAIKSVRSSAKVAGPALAGQYISYNWLEQAFQAGLLNHIDRVSIHPYRSAAVPPETVLSELAQVRAYIEEYKPAGKEIDIVTGEWGYHSDNTGTGTTQAIQAQYAARMFLVNLSAGMAYINWYSWKDNAATLDETENYGILTNAGAVKPAYTAFQTLSTVLSGYSYQQRIAFANADVWALKFTNASGKQGYALWTTSANATIQVALPAGSGLLHSLLGTQQSLSWGAGGPQITVTQSPQYLLVN